MFMPILASRRRSRSAFTLLELLIVIVIIAQLAAILFPVFSKVREKARRTSCASNLRQIGLAMEQYTQDYDERYPSLVLDTSTNTIADTWSRLLPYVKSEQLFVCPSDTRPVPVPAAQCPRVGSCLSNGGSSSYGFNTGGAFGEGSTVPSTTPKRLAGIFTQVYNVASTSKNVYLGAALAQAQSPETVFVAADGFGMRLSDYSGINSLGYRAYSFSSYPTTLSGWRHGNWRNTLYVDGHVKAVRWNSYRSTDGYPRMYPRSESDLAGLCFSTDVTVYGDYYGNPPEYDCKADLKSISDSYRNSLLPE